MVFSKKFWSNWNIGSTNFYDAKYKDQHSASFEYEKYINIPSILGLCPIEQAEVLDLGCGNGYFTRILENKFDEVTALDVDEEMIRLARKICKRTNFSRQNLDGIWQTPKKSFDIVFAKLLLMYISDLNNFASSVSKSLKPNGIFIVSVSHPLRWLELMAKKKGYNRQSLGPKFDSYFVETGLLHRIGREDELENNYIHRTLETYINTFRKNNLHLDLVAEPKISDAFLLKHPKYGKKTKVPRRLNLRFIKYEADSRNTT